MEDKRHVKVNSSVEDCVGKNVWSKVDVQRNGTSIEFVFFFKQKTAYEIVSRDWSSDVCSSDLFTGGSGGIGTILLLIFGSDPLLAGTEGNS